ncbi:Aldehyde dehydrogenase family 7 member B4 [Acorus calamus]|uniref:Aldehyde dehydrogenase family 7 member B4 n=1 Tax=Acorus calamus TaxID=4465 RepID=A0AAV9DPM7_ACOCL|nr:Aldehyde dehydrogenase family 7 member B4 [Acorus calamus]
MGLAAEYQFLSELGLGPRNPGCFVNGAWTGNGPVVASLNPANNSISLSCSNVIAEVIEASVQDYENGMQGGKILFGGGLVESEGNFVQPTIVEISPNVPVVKEELFELAELPSNAVRVVVENKE